MPSPSLPIPVPNVRQYRLLAIIALIVLAVIGWFLRPWLHWAVFGLTYQSPGMLQWSLIGVSLCLLAFVLNTDSRRTARQHRDEESDSTVLTHDAWYRSVIAPALKTRSVRTVHLDTVYAVLFVLGVAVLVIGFVGGGLVGGLYTNLQMSETVDASVTDIDTLPEADADNPRVLPAEVAHQYGQNSLQYPRHRMVGEDITYIDGTPHWSYALVPDGFLNSWVVQQEGAVYVDMTTQRSSVSVSETSFETRQGMAAWKNYRWQLLKDDYWVDYQDPMMVPYGDDQYIVVPYVEYDHQFRFTPLPQLYSVPEFGGVKIIDAAESIENVPAAEVTSHPVLEDQRVYPYSLTKNHVNSMQYSNGVLNKWFFHEDQLQIASLPGNSTEQPFTVSSASGNINYLVAVEPWGDASGIYQIWVADGQTGELARFQTDASNPLTGPAAATGYVMNNIDRAGLVPVEPIPIVTDETLYWQVKLLPSDGRGITYTAFVNADTTEVTIVRTDAAIRDFIAGANVDNVLEDGEGAQSGDESGSGTVVITIERADGSTEDIVLEEGESITITAPDDEA